jgi:23S rRNA (guanine2445-N2)-methyltransferase / 23S rRNA (guanine2069-N7)-methyltransferase
VYDADIPEFSFALDRYASSVDPHRVWFHLQEYQAPKTVDATVAAQRIELAQRVVSECFEIPAGDLYCKTRQRQRGRDQYEKQDKQGERFAVREGDAELLVNLSDYLDTGLFLDHRITRQMLREQTRDKSLLNLFCYTASVSLQAALGGADRVTSVDMSKTYLDWARDNFELNSLADSTNYEFVLADCVELLKYPHKHKIMQRYDVIFLDPPSFSNSKKMRDTLDVQRDHAEMILQASQLLAPGGMLYFSTNRRGFKLDSALSERFAIEDLSAQTIPEDFRRNPRIHQCWVMQRKA